MSTIASPINSEAIEAALARPDYIPSGITADFLEQTRDEPVIIGILFVGSFVTLIMALRCLARVVIARKFGLDDWLALVTLACFWAFVALCIVLIHLGSGRHFLYIEYILSNSTINKTEVIDFAAHIVYTTALAICRLSGLAFYARIADRQQKLTYAIRAAVVFVIAAYLPQVFLIIFHCLPVTGLWQYSFQPGADKYTCLQWGTVYVTNSAISVVCDLILFSLPIAIINSLRVSFERKLKLSAILMPGLLVIGISCVRMYLVIVGQWDLDESWSYDYLLAVEVSEIGSTLLALSIPALKPLFGSLFVSFDRTFISRTATVPQSGGNALDSSGDFRNGRGIELRSMLSRARSRILGPSQGSSGTHRNGRKISADLYMEGNTSYSAGALHIPETRKTSMGSGVSQQPIIQRDAQYSVSHEKAGYT